MQTKEPAALPKLLPAFAAVVAAFILATLYVNWRTLEIGAQTRNVSLNALPSIGRLLNASNELHDIEIAGIAYADLPLEARAESRRAIESKWLDVDRELQAYSSLPAFPGERELAASVPAALRASDEALRHFVDTIDSRTDTERLHAAADVHARFDEASAKLQDLMSFNARNARESALRIEALRDTSATVAVVLDGIAVLVALVAMAWVGALFRDHAALLRRHNELVEQRATELEGFGKRVAHDLLSPLTSLTYCLSAFKKAAEADPTLGDAMVRARTCVQRAQTMVAGIFDFARSGGKPEPGASAPLRETVDQVVEEVLATDAQARPEVEVIPFEALHAACNRGVLTSVLANLLRNAQKYMSDSSVRKITVRAREEGAFVRVEVEDTGPGVAPAIRDAIFEPYVRADGATQPGLGLGLATVKRLCVGHGGDAGVQSTLGMGSTFWFTLPKAESRPVVEVRSRDIVRT